MPCNIGYKSYTRASIPVPQPQKFKSKSKAPEVDADLLAKLGQDDPAFLDWMKELDILPLLKEALKRAVAVAGSRGLKLSISAGGQLVAEGEYKGSGRKRLEQAAAEISARWQMEALQVIVQLLGYETVMTGSGAPGQENWTIEGERHSDAGVHEYVRIDRSASGEAGIRFEHFSSKEAVARERDKLLALAQKLGIRIDVKDVKESGQPIAPGTVHRHFLKG